MAASFNNRPTQNIGPVLAPIYQATVKTIAIGALLVNKMPGYVPVTVLHRSAAGVDTSLACNESVRGGLSVDPLSGKKLVLLPGDQLMASAPIANSFDGFVSILEGVS